MKKIEFSTEKCTGCRLCELVCSASRVKKFNPKESAIFVESLFPDPGVFKVNFCLQCEDIFCVSACPSAGALYKNEMRIYVVDDKLCTGCGACDEACPYQGIRLDPSGARAIKCDLCGGKPKCVAICPTKALTVVDEVNQS